MFDTVDTLDNDFCPEAPPLRRQGWSVPRSRFCSSDNAFRPFPISCVIQILQICTRVQKSKNAIGFSKARRKVSPYLFQFSKLSSIALANSLNDWRLTSLNIRILFIGWYGLVQKFATFEGLANVLEKLAYMLNY